MKLISGLFRYDPKHHIYFGKCIRSDFEIGAKRAMTRLGNRSNGSRVIVFNSRRAWRRGWPLSFQFWWWLALSPHGEFQNDGYISVILSMFSSKFVAWHHSVMCEGLVLMKIIDKLATKLKKLCLCKAKKYEQSVLCKIPSFIETWTLDGHIIEDTLLLRNDLKNNFAQYTAKPKRDK